MTNINQINESAQSLTTAKTRAANPERTDGFGNALSKAFDKVQKEDMDPVSSNALGEISSVRPSLINPSDIVSGKTDKLLSMLETYSNQLQDPEMSLKNIVPVLEEIQAQAGTLIEEAQNLTEQDGTLKKIAAQTAVTAQTEYIKFQRGDYAS